MNQTPLTIELTHYGIRGETLITENISNLNAKFSLFQLFSTCSFILKLPSNSSLIAVQDIIQVDMTYKDTKTNTRRVEKSLIYRVTGLRPYSSGSSVDREIKYFIIDCVDSGMCYTFLTTYSNWYSGTTTQILEKYIKDIHKSFNDDISNHKLKLKFDESNISYDSFICVKRLAIKEIEYLINISRDLIAYRDLSGLTIRNQIEMFNQLSNDDFITIDEDDRLTSGFNPSFNYSVDLIDNYKNGLLGHYIMRWNRDKKTLDIYLEDRLIGSVDKDNTPEMRDLIVFKENFVTNIIYQSGYHMEFTFYQLFDIGQVLLYNNRNNKSLLNGKYFITELNIVQKDNFQLDFFYRSVKFSDDLI